MKILIILYISIAILSCSEAKKNDTKNIIRNLREDCYVSAKGWEVHTIDNLYSGSNSMAGQTAIQTVYGEYKGHKGNPACMTLCATINYPWDVYWDSKQDEKINAFLELDRIVPEGIRGKSPFQIRDMVTMVNDCTIQDMKRMFPWGSDDGGMSEKNKISLLEHALLYDPRKFKGTVYEVRLIRNGKPMVLKFPKE
jgi:hypothetical protein